MATLVVIVPGEIPTFPETGRRRATIASRYGTDTFPITNPETEHDNLAPAFVTTARPGTDLKPFTRQSALQLRTMRLEVILTAEDDFAPYGQTVDQQALALSWHARMGPCTIAYGLMEVGLWNITGLSVHVQQREPYSNNVLRALATLELTEAGAQPERPAIVQTASGGAPAPTGTVPAAKPGAAPKPRTYTVRKGDTLSSIAQRLYGHADLWPKIAKANHITDPRKLAVGRVLVIPA